MRYKGAVISATPPSTSLARATGSWTLVQQMQAQAAGTWPTQIGGTYWMGTLSGGSIGAITVDPLGNSYTCGSVSTNFLIAKYNSFGAIQWQRSLGGLDGNSNTGLAVATDSSGNVYVCGQAYSNVTGSPRSSYLELAKYDTYGVIQWQKSLGTGLITVAAGTSIAVDLSGNIYVSGFASPISSSTFYFQIAKYDNSGVIQWQRRLSSGSTIPSMGTAVDVYGNVYFCGDYGDGETYSGFLIAKYNTYGSIQWQRQIENLSSPFTGGSGIAVDLSSNVYIGGNLLSSGNGVPALIKYDTSGTLQWRRILDDGSFGGGGISVAVDPSGNAYVGALLATKSVIAKYDPSGTIQWQRSLSSGAGAAIAVDYSSNVYVTTRSGSGILVAKLPTDGSLTGTYTVGGTAITYAVTSYTAASSSAASAVAGNSDTVSTLADATSSLTDATTSLTSAVTTL